MVLNAKQIKTRFSMEWNIASNNDVVCNITSPFELNQFTAKLSFFEGSNYSLYYNPLDKSYGTKLEDRLSFKILDDDGNLLGHMVGKTKKTGKFFGGYVYFEIEFNKEIFYGYEIGLGKDGIKLCLYKGDSIVSIIDKNTKVVNFRDEYKMYLEKKDFEEVTTLFLIYYDMLKFANIGEIKLYSEIDTYLITKNKDLLDKYDPTFIPRIKQMDGIVD